MEKQEEVENQPKIQQNNKTLTFKEYPSIQNHYRDKFINSSIITLGYNAQDILWVASQKIHGSNFSIHCTGDIAMYGRRTDFLTKQIPIPCNDVKEYFLQSFYDARNIVGKFHNKLRIIYDNLKKKYPEMVKYSIYGQYFGGCWPDNHPNAIKNGPKQVQKGICYTPNHEFMAFDIYVVLPNKSFWVDVTDIPMFLQDHIPTIPIYAKGTFKQIFSIDTKFDSIIPELLGLPKLQNNIIEGLVLRPNKPLKDNHNERIIIKKKNQQFNQKVSAPKKEKQKVQKAIDPQIVPYLDILQQYLNINRIQSVLSKFPDLKDRNKLKGQIFKDIITDASKDNYKQPGGQLAKKVDQQFSKKIMKAIAEYYNKK